MFESCSESIVYGKRRGGKGLGEMRSEDGES